jgi:periplasmic protein TonB
VLRNLNPSVPINNGAISGVYTVIVQFIVDIDGDISNVTSLTKHGYGMEEEAMRVIRRGPKWEPAIQNGRKVKAYRKQPITFVVTEG